eukprot:m.1655198 g.1655198  ORF g.1655198 m.1655198 type:complete len:54 (-) comp103449_c0_seq1:151-312(-)
MIEIQVGAGGHIDALRMCQLERGSHGCILYVCCATYHMDALCASTVNLLSALR